MSDASIGGERDDETDLRRAAMPQRQLQSGGVDKCNVEGERQAMAIFQSRLRGAPRSA